MFDDNLHMLSRLLLATLEGLDITSEQFDLAVSRYNDLGCWLVSHDTADSETYPQGSFRLGTVLRPVAGEDFDIDLVFLRPLAKESITQARLQKEAGFLLQQYIAARGRANGKPTLKERNRCWTLTYPDDRFHLDVLPVIPDPNGGPTAVLLSDRDMLRWQHSNPIGYADWFWGSMGEAVDRELAQLAKALHREVEDIPQWLARTTLQRVVQLLKLHRNKFFHDNPSDRPPSILITTLAAHAYGGEPDLFEAFRDVARNLPARVERRHGEYWIPNPAHEGENFADRWNASADLKRCFDEWTAALVADVEYWANSRGIDDAARSLGTALGLTPVQAGVKRVGAQLEAAGSVEGLSVGRQGRVTQGSGTKIPAHRFHGQDQ